MNLADAEHGTPWWRPFTKRRYRHQSNLLIYLAKEIDRA